jgi:four helix bundle protein
MKPARHFEELIVWQLNDEIRSHILDLTCRPGLNRDLKLRSQLEDAAHSACRNIAEGFGSDSNTEFARFLVISRRSMNEVQDCLRGAILARHINVDDVRPIRALQRRAFPALNSLHRWLERHPGKRSNWRSGTDETKPSRTDKAKPARTDKPKAPRTDHNPPRTD